MSSGLPPILAANSATQQQTPFSNPFSHFGYLFGQQHQPFVLQTPSQNNSNRLKAKRHRQRVDAGEPRNTYQGAVQKNRSTISGHDDKIMMQIESPINTLWSTSSGSSQQQNQNCTSSSSNDGDLTTSDDTVDLRISCIKEIASTNTLAEVEENEIDGVLLDECEEGTRRDEIEESEDVEDEMAENGREESMEKEENRESPSSTSSASKRKSFMPQKIGEQLGIELTDEPEQINISVGGGSSEKNGEDESEERTPLSALQAQLCGAPTPNSNIFEAQKKIYAAFIEQQQRRIIQSQQIVQDRKVNTEQLVQTLKNEIMDNLNKTVEKIIRDWAMAELARQEAAANSANNQNSRPIPIPTSVAPSLPPFAHPIFPLQNHNPLAGFQLPNPHPIGGGIFPTNFNAFNHLQAYNALRRTLEENNSAIQEPKKKKAKLDIAKKEENDFSSPTPLSAPASPPISMGHHTPLNRYFPPTMVGHPLYGGVSFANDREDSPTNSDEMSDCGGYDGSGSSTTLTPMHLRKAKLMFFYKRYPDSNSLKPYFPDIRFNKNNTAQLVKWFSNFREFYYIQMEKFGRQLLAEGVKTRDEIFVSKDCELFKVLNTHYNRNNHIEPPPQLLPVIQETLREFYSAIREGKDIEPSWKKTIYKVIKEMDFDIPSAFKDANYPLDS